MDLTADSVSVQHVLVEGTVTLLYVTPDEKGASDPDGRRLPGAKTGRGTGMCPNVRGGRSVFELWRRGSAWRLAGRGLGAYYAA